jgi:hypothetical protein
MEVASWRLFATWVANQCHLPKYTQVFERRGRSWLQCVGGTASDSTRLGAQITRLSCSQIKEGRKALSVNTQKTPLDATRLIQVGTNYNKGVVRRQTPT